MPPCAMMATVGVMVVPFPTHSVHPSGGGDPALISGSPLSRGRTDEIASRQSCGPNLSISAASSARSAVGQIGERRTHRAAAPRPTNRSAGFHDAEPHSPAASSGSRHRARRNSVHQALHGRVVVLMHRLVKFERGARREIEYCRRIGGEAAPCGIPARSSPRSACRSSSSIRSPSRARIFAICLEVADAVLERDQVRTILGKLRQRLGLQAAIAAIIDDDAAAAWTRHTAAICARNPACGASTR